MAFLDESGVPWIGIAFWDGLGVFGRAWHFWKGKVVCLGVAPMGVASLDEHGMLEGCGTLGWAR